MSRSATAQPPTTAKKLTLAEALSSARETRARLVAPGALRETGRVFAEQFPGSRAVVVADRQTFALAGNAVRESLATAGVASVEPFIFDDSALYAEFRFVEQLEAALRHHDAIPVALGSGTVNDLAKLAAHRLGRPGYLCVATAASMDGYTAFGASITYRGAKQTFNCPAPRGVVADIDVIRQAPSPMTAAGYADLLAKVTAGADWILADALGAEAIDPRAWAIVQGGLREALADPAGARAGRESAIAPLVEGLMLGGFAMQWSKSSRPASGAEHQFSHLWDMEHHAHNGEAPSHGFKVGLATLAVTRLYERLLARPLDRLDVDRCSENWPTPNALEARIRATFAGQDFVETAVEETRLKHPTPGDLRTQLQRLKTAWPAMRARLQEQLLPAAEVQRRLEQVGAPTEPEQIGLSRARLRDSFARAYHIRRRFTVLDVAVRTRLLGPLLEEIFGAGGCWEITAAHSSQRPTP
ncbi:MAG TPA: sn-glycerol-1-phosphate dehydrogenase [Opitutaceae bacterium]|nr:sn-glycerol-1-phosphate dehydrogenase [Opitutaceae bacterium]